jgi:hypothetical protein
MFTEMEKIDLCLVRVSLHLHSYFVTLIHRCTRVKNPGEGVLEVFAKIPRGSRLSGKNARGGPPISGFIAFL